MADGDDAGGQSESQKGDGEKLAHGANRGRPAKLTEDDLDVARTLLANPDITISDVADRIGVSPATLYRYIPAARAASAPDV